jgi:drug/metabolite transporter (DMT)-like permease
MRIEIVPFILAALFGLIGLGLIADAWLPEEYYVTHERRRRRRTERHRVGEVLVGAGILALAAALAGRDSWRYGTVAMIAGAVLLAAGAVLNRRYLRELFAFRGASRRAEPLPPPPPDPGAPPPRTRLR